MAVTKADLDALAKKVTALTARVAALESSNFANMNAIADLATARYSDEQSAKVTAQITANALATLDLRLKALEIQQPPPPPILVPPGAPGGVTVKLKRRKGKKK